jgi:anti-anti-sigma factor
MLHVDDSPPPNRLELTSATDEIAVVRLIGEHDLGQFESLKAALAEAVTRARNVVVDLSECAFFDSTTISLLLHAHDMTTRDSGEFAVVIDPRLGPVSRLAKLVHLEEMLSIQPSLEAAIASFVPRHSSNSAS